MARDVGARSFCASAAARPEHPKKDTNTLDTLSIEAPRLAAEIKHATGEVTGYWS